MSEAWDRLRRPKNYTYDTVPQDDEAVDEGPRTPPPHPPRKSLLRRSLIALCSFLIMLAVIAAIVVSIVVGRASSLPLPSVPHTDCDDIEHGYTCRPEISRYWGQYSPYYSVPSGISETLPDTCTVTFAQVLSRHGARDPTAARSIAYRYLIDRLQEDVESFSGKYAFLKVYRYKLGADELSWFGQQELVNSGAKFFRRYSHLAANAAPVLRAAGQHRVVQSAQNFTQGFYAEAARNDWAGPRDDVITVMPEDDSSNNTLSIETCPAFDGGATSSAAQRVWTSIFVPPIRDRLNADMPGAELTDQEVVYLMDLCPFETVSANHNGGPSSPFCDLFAPEEWQAFEHYQSLGKWYGWSWGNDLAPSLGVGFVNELIARLTDSPVHDHTSTNSTLDSDPDAFPVGPDYTLYADFSHDNDIMTIMAALGVYNDTRPLDKTRVQTPDETDGYTASWAVPFASRMYVEKMRCGGEADDGEELVRVLVNDRVIPLRWCRGVDDLGRCRLSNFVEGLAFVRQDGHWDRCYA
ncbi:3-phytase A [Lineolata rhizophorae]|uniref:Phytase A n=1 Tax=Lineolata rhizophorae TaxID=578093 RepID=A0A6A6PF94_9PEZI|nr:3-phytase A [Lineolata rhizophorae]